MKPKWQEMKKRGHPQGVLNSYICPQAVKKTFFCQFFEHKMAVDK